MNDFLDWFQTADIFGLSLTSLALAISATLISYLLMSMALRLAVGRMRKMAAHTINRVDDTVVEVLSSTNRFSRSATSSALTALLARCSSSA